MATAAVTLTGTRVTACQAIGGNGHGKGDHGEDNGHGKGNRGDDDEHGKCKQGVSNGPENCDPGNSNNHNPSNDELGGTPGNPGRKGKG